MPWLCNLLAYKNLKHSTDSKILQYWTGAVFSLSPEWFPRRLKRNFHIRWNRSKMKSFRLFETFRFDLTQPARGVLKSIFWPPRSATLRPVFSALMDGLWGTPPPSLGFIPVVMATRCSLTDLNTPKMRIISRQDVSESIPCGCAACAGSFSDHQVVCVCGEQEVESWLFTSAKKWLWKWAGELASPLLHSQNAFLPCKTHLNCKLNQNPTYCHAENTPLQCVRGRNCAVNVCRCQMNSSQKPSVACESQLVVGKQKEILMVFWMYSIHVSIVA